jgi:chromosome segregation ATPase
MTDEQFNAMFRTVADHLESLAISIQSVEELQAQDRARQEQDRVRQETDRLRIDRLERLFKLMIRIGDRERKDLRERINALIDAQMRNEAKWDALQENLEAKIDALVDAQIRSEGKIETLNEKMQELSTAQKQSAEAFALFQAQMAETQKRADERMLRMEDANTQFQAQMAETQKRADERMLRMEDANTQFQAQMAEIEKRADERMLRMEDANTQFQAQVGQALSQLAAATALAHRRLDALESNP